MKTQEQLDADSDVFIRMERSSKRSIDSLLGLTAAFAGAAGSLSTFNNFIPKHLTRDYGPCIGCGNPAKGGHCFKCQQKEGAMDEAVTKELEA